MPTGCRFSDTITAKLHRYNLATGDFTHRPGSGDCPVDELAWRAEPGSNGMAPVAAAASDDGDGGTTLVVCQHGARRLALFRPGAGGAGGAGVGRMAPFVAAHHGRRLNGPNDVVVQREGARDVAYFTDPVYAFLEKERFADLPYLDKAVAEQGAGGCGVYRAELPRREAVDELFRRQGEAAAEGGGGGGGGPGGAVATRVALMDRPNGLAFRAGQLIVSDCCQGTHKEGCTQGISRWTVFDRPAQPPGSGGDWQRAAVIEDAGGPGLEGCADGFKVDPRTGLLVASCAGGVCIVDVGAGKVVARLRTTTADGGGFKVSNIVFAEAEQGVFLTTGDGIYKLPTRPQRVPPPGPRHAEL